MIHIIVLWNFVSLLQYQISAVELKICPYCVNVWFVPNKRNLITETQMGSVTDKLKRHNFIINSVQE